MIRELSWAVCENFTNRNIAQAFEHVAIVVEQIVAVLLEQCWPVEHIHLEPKATFTKRHPAVPFLRDVSGVVLRRHGTRLVVRRRPALIGHPPSIPSPSGRGLG
jgi:hypothetical protein